MRLYVVTLAVMALTCGGALANPSPLAASDLASSSSSDAAGKAELVRRADVASALGRRSSPGDASSATTIASRSLFGGAAARMVHRRVRRSLFASPSSSSSSSAHDAKLEARDGGGGNHSHDGGHGDHKPHHGKKKKGQDHQGGGGGGGGGGGSSWSASHRDGGDGDGGENDGNEGKYGKDKLPPTALPNFKYWRSISHDGTMTWYEDGSMLDNPACGDSTPGDDALIVAVKENSQFKCHDKLQLSYGGKSVQVQVIDYCEACEDLHIDATQGVWNTLNVDLDLGVVKIGIKKL